MKLWAVVEDGVINTSFEDDPSYFGEFVALYETQEQAQAHIQDGMSHKELKASAQNKDHKNKKRFYDKDMNRFTRRIVEVETGKTPHLADGGSYDK